MKRTFILEDLDCAHCAGKMEEGISKMEGVTKCSVNFLTKKMVIEAEDERMDTIVKDAKKLINKLEPDVTIIEK